MKPVITIFVAALGLSLLTAPTQAQSIYECSGVGLDEREAADSVPQTLRIEYAQPDGHYLGGIDTTISGSGGNEVLSVRCPGPWVLVNLPDGSYQVTSTFEGKTKTFGVTISGGKRVRQVVTF